ncbi:MAG: hypothetical protein EXR75_17200 [Myxococcales bacterium]|nr:hypothetical protein [Myxococcales bacterium]
MTTRLLHGNGRRFGGATLAALLVCGCNAITGADGLLIDDSTVPSAPPANDTVNADPQGDPPDANETPTTLLVGAPGVTLTRVTLSQGVNRTLMEAGVSSVSQVPVLAGRAALIRVFVEREASYDAAPVLVRVSLAEGVVLEQSLVLDVDSSEASLGSTINFVVDAAALGLAATLRVDALQLRGDPSAGNPFAHYPAPDAPPAALAPKTAPRLKLTLVPVRYDADGSGRLPDTSQAQLDGYASRFYSMYPVANVELSVRAKALNWNVNTSPNGSGWEQLLETIADLRSSDGAADDEYYYGIFAPSGSVESYCGGGCIAGLGYLGAPNSPYARAAIGLGFSGGMAHETALHELGHNHGREHAPCGGVASADSQFPYANGGIGSYGYDLLNGKLYAPNQYADIMGYCQPTWISDYTFTSLYQHATAVAGANIVVPPELMHREYQRLRVGADGMLTWLSPVTLDKPPMGEPVELSATTAFGTEQLTGSLFRFDHLAGGTLLVPPSKAALASNKTIKALIDGKQLVSSP